jgi:hypothetical protein
MEVSGKFMLWPRTPREETWYLLNRRLGKPQGQPGHCFYLPGFETKPSSLQQVTILLMHIPFLVLKPLTQDTGQSHTNMYVTILYYITVMQEQINSIIAIIAMSVSFSITTVNHSL